jgi:hypothetical protein
MGRRNSICAAIGIFLWIARIASGAVDIVGGTADSAGPNPFNGKGNAFRVDSPVVLTQQEFFLSFTGTNDLTFWVFDSPVEFGTYNLVQSNTVSINGTGSNFYSSGPISVPLAAGRYYVLAVSPLNNITYFFNLGPSQLTSFGAQVHGFATGVHPLGPSIDSSVDDSAIYYQRITTAVPEPIAVSALPLAALAAHRRRRLCH